MSFVPLIPSCLSCGLMAIFSIATTGMAAVIPNQLNHTWPGELVSFDEKKLKLPKGDLTLEVQGEVRPVQRFDGKVWSYVTIADKDSNGEKIDISEVAADFKSGKVKAGISMKKEGGFFLIDNGTYQFKLRNYSGRLKSPMALGKFPHWCGGMRSKGQKDWDGDAYFESNAKVIGAKTEVIAEGPVFLDFKITYEFEGETDGEANAMPLALGKQSHLFKPNVLPSESIPKRSHHYELMIRFVMDDIWIDVNERFHFPRDKDASPFGITHYYIDWGKKGLKVDTASWVRWFEYDVFGGNTDQRYVPAKPRPAQKGRPFALLRPRWNQGGGGAQDFVLTSGGAAPGRKIEAGPGYNPENPAVGVVAAYASKWVGPYVNYIPVYALGGNYGRARFPMVDGERSGMHYGQRAYGLLVGPRSRMSNLNSVVRRHTDWTLTAQINKYILDWKRDASKAGPNILMTRKQLELLQKDWKAGKKTAANEALKAKEKEWLPSMKEREKLIAEYDKQLADLGKRLEALKPKASGRDATKEAKAEYKKLQGEERKVRDKLKKDSRIKDLDKKLRGVDYEIYCLVTTGKSGKVNMPDSGLWRQRRYQDDFLNPTSSPTRRIPDFAMADLFAGGKSLGGASQAAMGYISTDLDAWPGYHHGWRPGNPNFHTDKYMATIYAGGALLDHPHSSEWLAFGLENFNEDLVKVLVSPDGVGAECPGYSGYAMKLQMQVARILMNTGAGNLLATNPLVKKNGVWHRKLITPYDSRIERRHEAPIGDTHRWDSGLYPTGFAKLASFFKKSDPDFASEMMATWKLLRESKKASGKKPDKIDLKEMVVSIDGSIPPADPARLDWSSAAFGGFGAVMRDGFGQSDESFVSYKAGSARGHYHNDENSFHFYSGGTPIALDYNCSYTPRGDHAALHNTVTFGKAAVLKHNGQGRNIACREELTSTAQVRHFQSTPVADLVVSERTGGELVMRPVDPGDHEFGRGYPTRKTSPLSHRRSLVFVKHKAGSGMSDYLVVRDECGGSEPWQINLHLLARDLNVESGMLRATGQMDHDMLVAWSQGKPAIKSWHYLDEWMTGPEQYTLRKGESQAAWKKRMEDLMKAHGVKSLPLPKWKPVWQNPKSEGSVAWKKQIAETDGAALMIPPYWKGSWMFGEYQKWICLEQEKDGAVVWVLYPHKQGAASPEIEVTGNSATLTLGGKTDRVTFDENGKVVISQGGRETVLHE